MSVAISDARQAISAAVKAERVAEQTYRESGDNMDLRRARNRAQSTTRFYWDELQKLQDAECALFAVSRGWRIGSRQIHVGQLIAGSMNYDHLRFGHRDAEDKDHVIDHAEYFMRSPPGKTSQQSCRYPAAILSHTYGDWEPCVEFAQRYGLGLERLPYSWYYPGHCIAALFTHIPK